MATIDEGDSSTRTGPLSSVTVLDLGQIYNGPYAGFLMAKAGARVIKVEPPRGDLLRGRGGAKGADVPFRLLNANKMGMTIDLKTSPGREVFLKLVASSQVVIENFRPGILDKLGLSDDVLFEANPALVVASGPGYAAGSIYGDYMAMDLTVQAMSGAMAVTGYPDRPPVKSGPALCDFLGGVHLFGAAMAALLEATLTGRGQHVTVPMLDATVPSLMSSIGLYVGQGTTGTVPPRTGNRHSGLAEAPYDVYPTTDGYVAVMCVSDDHWRRFATALDRVELINDPRFATRMTRVQNIEVLTDLVGEWSSGQTRAAVVQTLTRHEVPCAPVRGLEEVVHDEYLDERQVLQWVQDQAQPDLRMGSPIEFASRRVAHTPAPALGEHNETVLRSILELDDAGVAALVEAGAL